MKISREQLKGLVKECLVEILSEGLGSFNNGISRRAIVQPQHQAQVKNIIRSDNRVPSPALREAVKREAGNNPVLADILSDTAAKTLPNMLAGETRSQAVAGGVAEQIVANTAPDVLFGEESASRWASLAFMDVAKK